MARTYEDGRNLHPDSPIRKLHEHGPMTADELGNPKPSARRLGIRKFDLGGGRGNIQSGGGHTKLIYYLHGDHDPKEVIERWVEVNERAAEGLSDRALHARTCNYGDEWKRAGRELWDVNEQPPAAHTGGDQEAPECPICGKQVHQNLPEHLPCDGSSE